MSLRKRARFRIVPFRVRISAMGVIKPIETRYGGYRFRSRLEARWAVFLDHVGLRDEWEYEPEGYEIPTSLGTLRYLPDFWLDSCAQFGEVKGFLNIDG